MEKRGRGSGGARLDLLIEKQMAHKLPEDKPFKVEVSADIYRGSGGHKHVCIDGPGDIEIFVHAGNGSVRERKKVANRIARLLNEDERKSRHGKAD